MVSPGVSDNQLWDINCPTPFKQIDSYRYKLKKLKYKMTNWAKYTEALLQRGDISVCLREESVNNW